jgi:hypothetical protein
VWTYAADCVGTFVEASTSNTTEDDSDGEEGTSSKKKSKKRKRALKDRALLDSQGGVTEDKSVGRELMNATEWILDAVRLCCVHDSVKFIDQVRNPIVSWSLSLVCLLYDMNSNMMNWWRCNIELTVACFVVVLNSSSTKS